MAALQWIKTVWTKWCWTSVLEAILGNIMHSTAMQYINTIHCISLNWTALPGSCWEAKLVSWPRGGRVLSSPLPSFYHQSFTEFPEGGFHHQFLTITCHFQTCILHIMGLHFLIWWRLANHFITSLDLGPTWGCPKWSYCFFRKYLILFQLSI